ncbi:ScbA/BarX family gamma-butyrolactone biosynthesis protein [Streptacidiphilus melanogenes]|uniref:ScbA/BarX family gamma-butyrolactone biosynthesis protein n=1 Tax=Streptacidiphilus melanogenes TaxID=411235 RepID=UPI000A002D3C|nr:ScbA/BarX family gamma-butyrolactone biosynthesis protein [Streptacidiphilus melanogenes]
MTSCTTANLQLISAPPQTPTGILTQVRKSDPGAVLVSGWSRISDTTQHVTVAWPREQEFYTEDGRYRPLLFTESLRQGLALLSHSVHEVPLGHRLGWESVNFSVNPGALLVTSEPVSATLLVTHLSVRRRRLGSVHFASRVEARHSGLRLGTATVHYTTHPPALYDRLRGRYADAREAFALAAPPTPPVPPGLVGRTRARDVVLSPTGSPHGWQLRVDTGHGVLFDHPHDHIPGMVLLEAADQAAQAAMGCPVTAVAFDTTFVRYVEFDRPCLVTAVPEAPDGLGRARTTVEITQDGHRVFTSTVTTQPR